MKRLKYILILISILILPRASIGQPKEMVKVTGGEYVPLYGKEQTVVKVNNFYMDVYPVTNMEFQKFVEENPKWRRSQVKRIFADGNYLIKWESDISIGEKLLPKSPVTNVSWFAVNKYCKCQGKRLPTIEEWEYVAMADENVMDARGNSDYNQKILGWYEAPATFRKAIGSTFKNYWGIYDLHGLVWEWTYDFNSVLISGESRKDVDTDRNLFCGSAAIGANDLMNYAAFMRYAFRGSIKANYGINSLGFRCVKDIEDNLP